MRTITCTQMTERPSVITGQLTRTKTTFGKKVLALATSCLLMHMAHGTPTYSQTVFFGDSLSDTGNLAHQASGSFLIGLFGGRVESSFTTNPDTTWAKVLAAELGHSAEASSKGGTNYAVGGAKVNTNESQAFGLIQIPSTHTQITDYLKKTGDQADPEALYTVWIGANDLLGATSTNPLQTLATAAMSQGDAVNRLAQAGARYILVPNLPDVGLTPRVVNKPSDAEHASNAARYYNAALFAVLNRSDANVIPANTFALLQEATSDKAGFGFSNTTEVACKNKSVFGSLACKESDWVTTDANNTYVFADDIHPAGRTHRILAQYYHNILNAPTQAGNLGQALLADGIYHDARMYRRLGSMSAGQSVWADTYLTGDAKSVSAGLNHSSTSDQHTGIFVSYHADQNRLGAQMTSDTKSVDFGLYHGRKLALGRADLDVRLMVGLGRLSIDTARQVVWEGAPRTHTVDGRGRRLHGGVQVGYHVGMGDVLSVRPYVGAHAQRLKIDDMIESEAHLSTAMRYHKLEQDSLTAQVGVEAAYRLSERTQVQAGIGYNHEFKDEAISMRASLPSVREYTRGFVTDVAYMDRDTTTAHLGAKVAFGKADVIAGLDLVHQNHDTDVGGYLGVQMSF